jgi:signal recognition particle receptor subunit beta
MSRLAEVANALLSPSPLGLAISIVLVLTIPLFLHFFVFRASGLTTLPSILLIGPSGSGKTSLLTLVSRMDRQLKFKLIVTQFERGQYAATHTSQVPLAVECSLPLGKSAASAQYRSTNDPASQMHKKFLLVDTPGHGKLRHHALDNITNPQNLRGVIFLVDAASLPTGDESLRKTSEYLHDILLLLQKRMASAKTSKVQKELSLLIAANKMDLFTALPAALVKTTLEAEIGKVRNSRLKGLLDSGIGIGDTAEAENDDWVGEVGSGEFKFSQMEEFNIVVEVIGGSVIAANGSEVDGWWNWVEQRL